MINSKYSLFDGSIGSYLYQKGFSYPISKLNIENPKVIFDLHREYLDAGVDIITTNSFSADLSILSRYHLEDSIYEINFQSVKIAQKAIKGYNNRLIAGSIGPGFFKPEYSIEDGKLLKKSVSIQSKALVDGGVDIILLETILSLVGAKISLKEIKRNIENSSKNIKILLSFSPESSIDNSKLEQLLKKYDIESFGFNCGNNFNSFTNIVNNKIGIMLPSAGIPISKNGQLLYPIDQFQYIKEFSNFIKNKNLRFIGGCCGTTPDYIRNLKKYLDNL